MWVTCKSNVLQTQDNTAKGQPDAIPPAAQVQPERGPGAARRWRIQALPASSAQGSGEDYRPTGPATTLSWAASRGLAPSHGWPICFPGGCPPGYKIWVGDLPAGATYGGIQERLWATMQPQGLQHHWGNIKDCVVKQGRASSKASYATITVSGPPDDIENPTSAEVCQLT